MMGGCVGQIKTAKYTQQTRTTRSLNYHDTLLVPHTADVFTPGSFHLYLGVGFLYWNSP